MVTIRLSRTGAKKRPFYHVVVTDSRNARDGRFKERLGYYNPLADEARDDSLHINDERFEHWLSKGAQMSERVAQLYKMHRKKAVPA
ncbi:MAG TPA: 30S ribosomal protein S16 [Gammaproteobacteria bacterium]|nr:30S ribosomal protein S16 [Gammaproteobacteria bacterium]